MIDLEERWRVREEAEAAAAGLTVEEYRSKEQEERKARQVESARREAIRLERERRSSLLAAGVPLRPLESAEAPIDTPALREAWRDVDLLVLAGTPGVGKSVAACVWLCINGDREGCIPSWRWIQAGEIARGFAYDAEAFKSIVSVRALVIDDLGLEYLDQKDRYLSTMEEILSARYANRRPTLLTTNLTPEKFKERYGERLVSRINEDGAFVVCGGEDLRRRAA
jgi:DNA replication protein DnaC